MSNEVEVIKDVPFEDRQPGLEINSGNLPVMKTLGVSWQANRDVFTFQVTPPPLSELTTKKKCAQQHCQVHAWHFARENDHLD